MYCFMPNSVDRYIQVESALVLSGIEISASEVHGTIVGAIANHMKSGQSPDLLRLVEPNADPNDCLLYTSPSPRDRQKSRMPSSA